ncbi:MAG: BMP family ABC transporter substrate-binding protein [Anaerolineales bacterium]
MKIRILSLLALVALSLNACAPAASTPSTQKVVYLINGALGDNAFYDSGQLGMDNLKSQYGVETRTIEAQFDAGKYQPSIDAAVQFADVIFVIAYGFEDQLKEAADKYPNKVFVNLDFALENSKDTITSVDFIEEESAYLAGVAAALATTDTSIKNINPDKVIGAVGGDIDPVIPGFIFAYENGAKSIHPDIQVEVKSLGGVWDDPAKGKEAALQLFDQKADVVFQIAAASGLGVLQAAKERELYAIGVDTNQNDLEPGYVIASDIKNIGKAIEDVYATIRNGTYKAGEVLEYGLKQGGVDIALEAQVQVLPQAARDQILQVRQQIIDGTLKIERYVP